MTLVSGDITSVEMTFGRLDRLPAGLLTPAFRVHMRVCRVCLYCFFSSDVQTT